MKSVHSFFQLQKKKFLIKTKYKQKNKIGFILIINKKYICVYKVYNKKQKNEKIKHNNDIIFTNNNFLLKKI